MKGKPVSASAIDRQVHEIFPNDLNDHKTAFGGRIMEITDRLAGVVAQLHSGKTCVTLGIDSVRFLAPALKGELLIFKAAVNRVWRTSVEIGVKVFAKNFKTKKERHVVSAYFTFVAVDRWHRPVKVPPVIPETPEEKRRYQDADERRQHRLKTKQTPR